MAMERILGTETGKSAFEKTDRNVVALDASLTADKLDLAALKSLLTLFTSGKVEVKITDGNGVGLCPYPNASYLLWVQDMGNANSYLLATGVRHSSVYPDGLPHWTIINASELAIGASNSQGSQVINGASALAVRAYCIAIPYDKYPL